MKRLFSLISFAALVALSLSFGSCHGQSDEPVETDPKTEVPAGVLRIFADKESIAADGADVVTFTVMFGQEDVSSAKTLQLIRTIEGKDSRMQYGVSSFSTVVPGEYTFRAEYYSGEKFYTDNQVKVVVTPTTAGGDTKNYAQRTLGFQFTSVGCPSCPTLAANLKSVQAAHPDRLIPVAFHKDFGKTDPMTIPMSESYYKLIKRQGLPQFNANLIIDEEYMTIADYATIVEILDKVEAQYPATCGVAIESQLSDGGVTVTAKVTSNTPSAYRYQIFLVEDDVESSTTQDGADMDYRHYNVVRATSSTSVYGDRLNDGVSLQVGVEVSATKQLEFSRDWNEENLRLVVAAFVSYDGGNTYVVNNCAECPVGESVDYNVK